MDETLSLRAQLAVKKIQIQKFVAKKHGMGNLTDLSPADYLRVASLTDNYLEIWEEAFGEGHPDTQGTDTFHTLAREHHEIQKQIEATDSS